jgi:hypothetical protein
VRGRCGGRLTVFVPCLVFEETVELNGADDAADPGAGQVLGLVPVVRGMRHLHGAEAE